jgi:hypothetical protein
MHCSVLRLRENAIYALFPPQSSAISGDETPHLGRNRFARDDLDAGRRVADTPLQKGEGCPAWTARRVRLFLRDLPERATEPKPDLRGAGAQRRWRRGRRLDAPQGAAEAKHCIAPIAFGRALLFEFRLQPRLEPPGIVALGRGCARILDDRDETTQLAANRFGIHCLFPAPLAGVFRASVAVSNGRVEAAATFSSHPRPRHRYAAAERVGVHARGYASASIGGESFHLLLATPVRCRLL